MNLVPSHRSTGTSLARATIAATLPKGIPDLLHEYQPIHDEIKQFAAGSTSDNRRARREAEQATCKTERGCIMATLDRSRWRGCALPGYSPSRFVRQLARPAVAPDSAV